MLRHRSTQRPRAGLRQPRYQSARGCLTTHSSSSPTRRTGRRDCFVVETTDVAGDDVKAVLHGEVSGLEAMQLRLGQVAQVCLATLGREEDVPLPPEDQRVRLLHSQELLPRGVQRDIRTVVVEQIELYATGIWPLHEAEVHLPVVRTDEFGLSVAVLVHEFHTLEVEKRQQPRLGLWSGALPERMPDAGPRRSESFFVRVRVLENKPLHPPRCTLLLAGSCSGEYTTPSAPAVGRGRGTRLDRHSPA